MAVKREKCRALGRLVLEDQRRAVILLARIVGQAVYAPGQRRINRRAGRREDIDAEVHRAALVMVVGEHVRQVNRARFVVVADADFTRADRLGAAHARRQPDRASP